MKSPRGKPMIGLEEPHGEAGVRLSDRDDVVGVPKRGRGVTLRGEEAHTGC